jgi:hypothetical protein
VEDRTGGTGDSLLAKLIEEDHGLELRGRWGRSDTKSSLVYDGLKDLFYYNKDDICGDAFTYLTQMRGWDFNTAKEYLKQNNFTATFVQEISNGQESVVYPKLLEIWSENLEEGDKSYFYNRMLTDQTIRRFKLGYFNQFYTIPIFMDGTLKQFQMRRDSPKLIKNYYAGVGPLLFHSEILQITDTVYITEGLIGTILLSQFGVPACSMNIGAEGFQAKWAKYFTRIKQVNICFEKGTEVVTTGGIKSIENVTTDDCVFTHLGNIKPVTEVMQNCYTGKMVAFNTVGGGDITRRFYMTPNHPLYMVQGTHTYRNNRGLQFEGDPKWESAGGISVGDYLLEPVYNFNGIHLQIKSYDSKWVITERNEKGHVRGTKKFFIPIDLSNDPCVRDKDFSYLIGLFLGDGHFKSYKSGVTGRFELAYHAKNKRYILDRVKSYLDHYGFKYTTYETGNTGSLYCYDWRLNFFNSFYSKEGGEKRHKNPPIWLAFASNLDKEEMFSGLMDSDGNINKRGDLSFTNTNRIIIQLAEFLAGSLGKSYITTGYRYPDRTWKHRQTVCFTDQYNGRAHTYTVMFNDIPYIARKVTEVYTKDVVNETVYNMEVEDDHSYLLTSKMVAHNCFDRDTAGDAGALKIAKILGQHRCKIYNFWDFDNKYAVDDFFLDNHGVDELEELVKEQGKYAFEFEEKKVFTRRTK